MSAVTKNRGKRGLRATKRHLWFEWIRSCQSYMSNTGEMSRNRTECILFVCFSPSEIWLSLFYHCFW